MTEIERFVERHGFEPFVFNPRALEHQDSESLSLEPRVRNNSVVLSDGCPIDRIDYDVLLFNHGFVRVGTYRRNKRLYTCIGRQLGFGRRACKRLTKLVEATLKEMSKLPSYEPKADSSNDRLRLVSHLFKCSITIFGTFDLKHHRHFSSGKDTSSILLLEVDHGKYEALVPQPYAPMVPPNNSPNHYGTFFPVNQQFIEPANQQHYIDGDVLCDAFSVMNVGPSGMLPYYYHHQPFYHQHQPMYGCDDVFY